MCCRLFKSLCFFLGILLFSWGACAQTDINQLRAKINTAKNDTHKVHLYMKASELYRISEPDSAYKMAQEGLKLAEALGHLQMQAFLSGQLGGMDKRAGRLVSARVRLQNSMEFYERLSGTEFKRSIALLKLELGVVDGMQGKYDAATRNFLSALKIFDSISYTEGKVQAYMKLGVVNQNFDNLTKAHDYYITALALAEQIKDTIDLAYLYNDLIINAGRQGHYDTAMAYYNKGIAFCTSDRYLDVKTALLLNAGILYKVTGNEDKALEYFNEAISITRAHNMLVNLPNLLLNVAMLEKATPHAAKIPMLKEALSIATTTEQQEVVANIYEMMAEVYKEEGNYKDAYLFKDSSNIINNNMFNVQKNSEIANLQALYDLDKSHNKILELELTGEKRDFQRNVMVVIAVAILIALVGVTIIYRRTVTLNARLEASRAELVKANTIKDKMFSIIGHDLRTPTHTIIGMLRVLSAPNNDVSKDEEQGIYKTLIEQSEASLDTLNKLLLWGSRQIKGISLELEQFEVGGIIESTIKLLHEGAAEKSVAIVNKVPDKVSIYADKSHFDFIVRNLLSNGVKFSNSGSNVEIGVKEQGNSDFVCFYVQDHGVGIKPELQDAIFGLNSTSSLGTENEKGTGLGLVLCSDFVRQDGGKIWVESEEGKGSIFFFLMRKLLKY